MELGLKLLSLILLIAKSLAAEPEVCDNHPLGVFQKKTEATEASTDPTDYEKLMTFTYRELRAEVAKELLNEFEQRKLKALEKKRVELGLKEGDLGYDDVTLDFWESRDIFLDTDPEDYDDYINQFGQGEEKEMTAEEKQLAFEKFVKKLLRGQLRDHFARGLPDVMAERMLSGLHDFFANDDFWINALKYKGKEYESEREAIKRIEDFHSDQKISLSKLKKLQKEAYDLMMKDDFQVDEYNKEKEWKRTRSYSSIYSK